MNISQNFDYYNENIRPLFHFESKVKNDFFDLYIGSRSGGRLINSIKEAKNSIKIASPYLSSSAVELLREKYLGGLKNISIITTAEEKLSNNSHIKGLKKIIHCEKQKKSDKNEYIPIFNNIIILKGNFFHVKFSIIDDEIVYIGSMNFTMKGMEKNIESNITFKDIAFVQEFIKYFDKLLSVNFDNYKWDISELGEIIYKKIYHYKELFRALQKKYNINTDNNDDYNKINIYISNELKNKFSCNEKYLKEDKSFLYEAEITKEIYDYGLDNIDLSLLKGV